MTHPSTQSVEHADNLYKYEHAHGTRYLGKMGRMAFAHFDLDEDGTLFPLAMRQSQFEQNRDQWEEIEPSEAPDRVLEAIEEKFAARKSLSDAVTGGGKSMDGTDRCACCGDPAEDEKHNLNGPLCLDCAVAGCPTGTTTCHRSLRTGTEHSASQQKPDGDAR